MKMSPISFAYNILAVTLLTLKIIGALDWSWIWATALIWAPVVLILVLLAMHALLMKFDRRYRLKVLLDRYARAVSKR